VHSFLKLLLISLLQLPLKVGALAAGDIMQSIDVPANTMILAGGIEVITALDASADGTTFNLGVTGTGGIVTSFCNVVDFEDSAAGSYFSTGTAGASGVYVTAAADTVDLELQALSTTVSTGVVRIFVVCIPVDAKLAPGVAAIGS
jgi:hypothetical protein